MVSDASSSTMIVYFVDFYDMVFKIPLRVTNPALFSCFPDHDECKLHHHGCQHVCNNLLGSFYCSCHTGYALNMDNKTCSGKRCFET